MTVTEKVAFLKGMMEGMEFQTDSKEGKLIKLMAEILEDLAQGVTECQDDIDDINEYMEAMDEDLTHVEEELFGEFDDEDDECCCDECEDEDCYEIECPHCGETVCFKEAPEGKTFPCPSCSKEIPLD